MRPLVVLSVFAAVVQARRPCNEPDCARLIQELFSSHNGLTTEDHLMVFEACRSCCWGIDTLEHHLKFDADRRVIADYRPTGYEVECLEGVRDGDNVYYDTKIVDLATGNTRDEDIDKSDEHVEETASQAGIGVAENATSSWSLPFTVEFTNPFQGFDVANLSPELIFGNMSLHKLNLDSLSFDILNLDNLRFNRLSLDKLSLNNLPFELNYETLERFLLLSGGASSFLSNLIALVSWLKKRYRKPARPETIKSQSRETDVRQTRRPSQGVVKVVRKAAFDVGRRVRKIYHITGTWTSPLSQYLPSAKIVRNRLGKIRGIELSINDEPVVDPSEDSTSDFFRYDGSTGGTSPINRYQLRSMPWMLSTEELTEDRVDEPLRESIGDFTGSFEMSSNEAERLLRSPETPSPVRSKVTDESSEGSDNRLMYMKDGSEKQDQTSRHSSSDSNSHRRQPIFYRSNSSSGLDGLISSPLDSMNEQLNAVRDHARYGISYADQGSTFGLLNHNTKAPSSTYMEEHTVPASARGSMDFVDLTDSRIPNLVKGLKRKIEHAPRISEDRRSTGPYLGRAASHVDSGFGGSSPTASRSVSRSEHLTMDLQSARKPSTASSRPRPRTSQLLSSSRSLKSVKSCASVKVSGPDDDFDWTRE